MTMSRTAPINGEILVGTPPAGAGTAASRETAAEDAEYITLDDAGAGSWPPAVPPAEDAAVPQQGAPAADGLGILRPRQAGDAERAAWPGQAAYAALFALAVGATFWFSGGYALVGKPAGVMHRAPLTQVRIAKAESRLADRIDGPGVILINGTVANDSADAQGVPPIAVKVTAGSGRTQRYIFGMQNRILDGGETMDFAYRLDAPAGGVKNVDIVLAENR